MVLRSSSGEVDSCGHMIFEWVSYWPAALWRVKQTTVCHHLQPQAVVTAHCAERNNKFMTWFDKYLWMYSALS